MIYQNKSLLVAATKKELEEFINCHKLCGPVDRLNGVWMYKVMDRPSWEKICNSDQLVPVSTEDLVYVLDKLACTHVEYKWED